MNIRKANINDWKIILNIEKIGMGKYYSTVVTKKEIINYIKNEIILIAFEKKEIVGKISFKKNFSFVCLSGLVIYPKWRNKGYGEKLSQYILDLLPYEHNFTLTVHPENLPAIHIYKKLGFLPKEIMKNYFNDGEPRQIMTLQR